MTDAVDTEALHVDGANALDETSHDEAAPSDKDDVVHLPEDSWYGGLKLVSTLELDGAASDDGDPDIEYAQISSSTLRRLTSSQCHPCDWAVWRRTKAAYPLDSQFRYHAQRVGISVRNRAFASR